MKMKRTIFVLFFVAAIAVWSTPGFATTTITGDGPLSTTTDNIQFNNTGSTHTLTVGTQDIYTNNELSPGIAVDSTRSAISTDVDSHSNITFNGNSTVYGYIGGIKVFLNIVDASSTVNFLGAVNTTTFSVGTGAMNFKSGSVNNGASSFTGDGTIALDPNTTLQGALTTATNNTGTLSLGSGSVLTGAVGGPGTAFGLKAINVVGGSNDAGVSATISGAVNAYTFSLGTNTLNIGGALTIADNSGVGGIINTTLASPTVYGHIVPVGAASLGSALTVNVTVPSTAVIPVGTLFNVVAATSGTNGSLATVTIQDPTNPLYKFEADPLTGTVSGLLTIKTITVPLLVPIVTPPGVVLPPAAPLAAPVAAALLAAPLTADMTEVVAAVNALSDPAAVVNAEAQLAPSTPALAAPLVTFRGAKEFQNLWSSRLDVCSQVSRHNEGIVTRRQVEEAGLNWEDVSKKLIENGWAEKVKPGKVRLTANLDREQGRMSQVFGADFSKIFPVLQEADKDNSTCRLHDARGGWWGKGFGYFGHQDARSTFTAYDTEILGTMIAYDAPILPNTRAGLGFGYAHSTIDGKTYDAETDFDTYQLTAYIGHELGPWFVHGSASVGWNKYFGERHIVFPGIDRTAKSRYDGEDYTAFMDTGYHFFAHEFTLTPIASLQYSRVNVSGYTEKDAGDINLKVESQGYDFLESGLGAKVERDFSCRAGVLVPELHFKWLYELSNPKMEQNAAFLPAGSQLFTTPGLRTDRDTYNAGTGLTLLSCSCGRTTWSVEGVYDYYWRTDGYSAHQGMVKFTIGF